MVSIFLFALICVTQVNTLPLISELKRGQYFVDKAGFKWINPWHCCSLCPDGHANYIRGRCVNGTQLQERIDEQILNATYIYMTNTAGCCYFCGARPDDYFSACNNSSFSLSECPTKNRYCVMNKEKRNDLIGNASDFASNLGAPRSRISILTANDGPVMPPGSLALLPEITYDTLIQQYIGIDSPENIEQLIKWMTRYGLLGNTGLCKQCQQHQAALVRYKTAPEGYIWRCNHCRHEGGSEESARMSIRTGSFFENVHLSLHQWLKLIFYWSTHPESNLDIIMRETNIKGTATIVDAYNFLREICQAWAQRVAEDGPIGGYGKIVEIDESKFFKAKYNRGRMLARTYDWVFGMVERGTSNIRLFHVQDRTAATLLPIIAENVAQGTMVVSDGWASYGGINALQQQYDHQWVNHRVHFVNPQDPQVHTQTIEVTWRSLKDSLRHLHGTSKDLLPTYLYQYMFRRKHENKKIFQQILEEMRRQYPV